MNITLGMYLADVVDGLRVVFVGISLIIGFLGIFPLGGVIVKNFDPDDPDFTKDYISLLQKMGIALTVSLLFVCFIPSKATVYTYMAESVGEQILKNPDAQEIMGDTILLLKKKLKEELSDD